jgi:hypothetical protein
MLNFLCFDENGDRNRRGAARAPLRDVVSAPRREERILFLFCLDSNPQRMQIPAGFKNPRFKASEGKRIEPETVVC